MSSPTGIPNPLIKYEVRYEHHRAVDWDKLPPMMRQYVELKDQYRNAILLYRLGDFFECFFQDAITVSRELELTLTGKEAGKEVGRVPMSGIPHHALDRYAAQLVEKGYAIAVCDQVEDAAQAQGNLVRREITRVITPGTVLEEGLLQARRNNFLVAVVLNGNHWGLAAADISTGEFSTTQATGLESLTQELLRLQPSEILYPTDAPDLVGLLRPQTARSADGSSPSPHALPDCFPTQFCYTLRPQSAFSQAEARNQILQKFRVKSLEGFGCDDLPLAVRSAGGLLNYLEDTQKTIAVPLQQLHTYTLSDYLILDHSTRRNLEITQTVRDGTFFGSLLWALDQTVTTMGGRALRRWLLQPLLDRRGILARQDTIQELVSHGDLRQALRSLLKEIYDLERLAGRAGTGTANARDLVALADSLARLPELARLVADCYSPYLRRVQTVSAELEALGQKVHQHLVDSPPVQITEGGLIRAGVSDRLDGFRHQVEEDQRWIANLEVSERERTGITTLKVGFNKTFGYYISISRGKSGQIPDNYIRKQTLSNEERCITPDLKERESRILNAQSMLNQMEYDLFVELRNEVGQQAESIRSIAQAIAAIDVLAALADVAVYQGYCRPEILEGRAIAILEGRHPVVEKSIPTGFFVPNSTHLGAEALTPRPPLPRGERGREEQPEAVPDLIILTGPNASGKSCYLRQVGLIQLMAQVGSFVPAKSAKLSICDRIFTRVGAVDDLATGQSTFMVEMNETANILNHATARSLVLLDEIGRGTATFDGLSIAWSVAEYLATTIKARAIFATHYHEMNELASLLSNIANFQVVVKELPDQIIFLHQVQPGGADKSYGIEAARLAGLPPSVIQRAKQVMAQIEKHSKIAVGLRKGNGATVSERKGRSTLSSDDDVEQLGIF